MILFRVTYRMAPIATKEYSVNFGVHVKFFNVYPRFQELETNPSKKRHETTTKSTEIELIRLFVVHWMSKCTIITLVEQLKQEAMHSRFVCIKLSIPPRILMVVVALLYPHHLKYMHKTTAKQQEKGSAILIRVVYLHHIGIIP